MASNVLTPEEEEIIREQSKRCSLDTKQLLAIIQRLVNLLDVPPKEEIKLYDVSLIFSNSQQYEIRRIAREEIRAEQERNEV